MALFKTAVPQALCDDLFTPEALAFVHHLHRTFNPRRLALLQNRIEVQRTIDNGYRPTFLQSTQAIRESNWQVAPAPKDLVNRCVEITGPTDRKMMINALNSGARVFMADLEDSLSPTFANILIGQKNLKQAVRGTLSLATPEGKTYTLNPTRATLVVRPRGWHLDETNFVVDDGPMSASLFDFGVYFFNNAHALIERGSGPYFYLPKMESHLEARLWNDVFVEAQSYLRIPKGTIRATVLIETILAAFEMEEILYELRDHASGLNAGRWDYIFSIIKKFCNQRDFVLPDRSQVTMDVPFMRAYAALLVKTCHKRGAHAMGGMAAFIPSRKDPAINERALAAVRADKEREARDGFDGTWVAHPDLVAIAEQAFASKLGASPHQKHVLRKDVKVKAEDLLDTQIAGSSVTDSGVRSNISVALQYIAHWLEGRGAVALNNLMEDAATAEIARAQLWQWLSNRTEVDTKLLSPEAYAILQDEIVQELSASGLTRLNQAAEILRQLVCDRAFTEFLTTSSYNLLDHTLTQLKESQYD